MFNIQNFTQVITPNSPFGIFLTYCSLFFLGGFIGFVAEVLFRRFVSMKRWINPGFLKGPCIPLYGFGLCALHFISSIVMIYFQDPNTVPDFYLGLATPQGTLPFWATSLLAILLIGVSLTLIEYLGGLLFVKGLHIKLWDYSKMKGNIQGIICPLFSIIWLLAGAGYRFGLAPLINKFISLVINHMWGFSYFIGALSATALIDFVNSVIVSIKLSGKAKEMKLIVDFEKFKILNKKGLNKFTKTNEFINSVKEAATPIKNKIVTIADNLKSKMYIDNEIPEKNESETPRTKSKSINNGEE